MIKVAPSLLAADFGKMNEEIARVAQAGADYLHFDVMDGRFVPNISFGLPLLECAAKGPLPVDAHLMIVEPEKFIDKVAAAGAKIITVHAEATHHLHRALQQIRAAGCLAGVALNPATPIDCLKYLTDDFDLVLVMTINPGFGGQKLIPSMLTKIRDVRRLLVEAGSSAMLEVDGGVNAKTAAACVNSGADVLVAGTACFGANDSRAFIESVKKL